MHLPLSSFLPGDPSPFSSSNFFNFATLGFSASAGFSLFGSLRAPGRFSVSASCSYSAKRWYASCSTLVSFGVVSTPSPDLTSETLNCSSRCCSRVFFVIFSNPFSCRAGSGAMAPISFVLVLHLNHRRRASGPSKTFGISGGSSRLRSRFCLSETPPGLYATSKYVSTPNVVSLREATNSSRT